MKGRNKEMEVKQIHCGQYKRYGDFFRVWEVKTDNKNKEEVLEYLFENVYKRKVPLSGEWHANVRYGGEKFNDLGYYFTGYYSLTEIDGGYKFTVCEPYAD